MSASTKQWLLAFVKANNVTVEEMLAQAAFCIADYAGRREGSWEAGVGGDLVMASGYQEAITSEERERLYKREEAANEAWRRKVQGRGK